MRETKFYICEKCGNIITLVEASGAPVSCCGQRMTELKAGTVEASREKHIPVAVVEGHKVKVSVGSVAHPMSEEHNIAWVYLETDKGHQIKYLASSEAPEVEFAIGDEVPVAVYAYCNLHGLWKSEIR